MPNNNPHHNGGSCCESDQTGEQALDRLKSLGAGGRPTKRERKLLNQQEKQLDRLNRIKKQKAKSLAVYAGLFILLAGALAFFFFNYQPKTSGGSVSQGTPRLEIAQAEFDAGTISMREPPLKHTFEIKNAGQGDLEIKGIKTSCNCTSAVLKTEQETSPKFSMHNNPLFWTQTIPPGQTGLMEVKFDQAFHGPEATGPAVREIYFSSNDPEKKQSVLRLLAEVAK